MAQRQLLNLLLREILGSGNVYFQPPADVKMQYDAIVYELDDIKTVFADNKPYRNTKRYQLMFITREADNDTPDKIAELPLCAFERYYVADNLHHHVFNIFF